MSQTYVPRRRAEQLPMAREARQTAVPGPSLRELAAGAAPSREQLGRRVDLPEAIREKMEASFGADFSNVKLYESRTVADAGAEAMAMGGAIGFAPGKLELGSTAGQAKLGHELSHVVSQARGEVRGAGFLSDHALEARADREGALAAAGESVYSGPVAPLSASAVPAAAAGTAQALGKEDTRDQQRIARRNKTEKRRDYLENRRKLIGLHNRHKDSYHPEMIMGLPDKTVDRMRKNGAFDYLTRWEKGALTYGNDPILQRERFYDQDFHILSRIAEGTADKEDTFRMGASTYRQGIDLLQSHEVANVLVKDLSSDDETAVLSTYGQNRRDWERYRAIKKMGRYDGWKQEEIDTFEENFALLDAAMRDAEALNDYHTGDKFFVNRSAMARRRRNRRDEAEKKWGYVRGYADI